MPCTYWMTPNRQLSKWIGVITVYGYPFKFSTGLLPANQNWRLRMRQECGEHYPSYLLQRKPLVGNPGMHHGTCLTHVPWRMSGSLYLGGGENVPGITGACATRNFTYLTRSPWYCYSLEDQEPTFFFNRQQIFKLMAMSCHKLNGYPNTDPQNFHQAKRPIALSSRNGVIRLVVRTRTIIMISYHFIQDTARGSWWSNQPLR